VQAAHISGWTDRELHTLPAHVLQPCCCKVLVPTRTISMLEYAWVC